MWAVILGSENIVGDKWNSCGGAGSLSAFRPGGQGEVQNADGDLVGTASIGTIENLIPAMSMFESVRFGVSEAPDVEIALRLEITRAFPRACFLQIRAEGLPPDNLYRIVIGGESFVVEGELGAGFNSDGAAYRGDWRLGS